MATAEAWKASVEIKQSGGRLGATHHILADEVAELTQTANMAGESFITRHVARLAGRVLSPVVGGQAANLTTSVLKKGVMHGGIAAAFAVYEFNRVVISEWAKDRREETDLRAAIRNTTSILTGPSDTQRSLANMGFFGRTLGSVLGVDANVDLTGTDPIIESILVGNRRTPWERRAAFWAVNRVHDLWEGGKGDEAISAEGHKRLVLQAAGYVDRSDGTDAGRVSLALNNALNKPGSYTDEQRAQMFAIDVAKESPGARYRYTDFEKVRAARAKGENLP
jgi:hypothetical protein